MQKTIDSERKREKECYHKFAHAVKSKSLFAYRPLSEEVGYLQFLYENEGHAYAVSADHGCAYLTSPVADEDI